MVSSCVMTAPFHWEIFFVLDMDRKSLRLQSAPPISKAQSFVWDNVPNVIQPLNIFYVVHRHLNFQRKSSQHLDLAELQTCVGQKLEKKKRSHNLLNDTELRGLSLPSTKFKEWYYCHLLESKRTAEGLYSRMASFTNCGYCLFFFLDVPKFPKETLDPVVVEEGQAFILKCDPPNGIPPLQIYWMTISK